MGKTQKTVSISLDEYADWEKFYAANRMSLGDLGIRSVPQLIQVAARHGKKNLTILVATADKLRMNPSESLTER